MLLHPSPPARPTLCVRSTPPPQPQLLSSPSFTSSCLWKLFLSVFPELALAPGGLSDGSCFWEALQAVGRKPRQSWTVPCVSPQPALSPGAPPALAQRSSLSLPASCLESPRAASDLGFPTSIPLKATPGHFGGWMERQSREVPPQLGRRVSPSMPRQRSFCDKVDTFMPLSTRIPIPTTLKSPPPSLRTSQAHPTAPTPASAGALFRKIPVRGICWQQPSGASLTPQYHSKDSSITPVSGCPAPRAQNSGVDTLKTL